MRPLQLQLALPANSPGDRFTDDLRAFREFGRPTQAFVDDGIPYFVNEYWTARQRQSHALHEVSYRACFKPQLPAFFIDRLTAPGDRVYDPFMGRGTIGRGSGACARFLLIWRCAAALTAWWGGSV